MIGAEIGDGVAEIVVVDGIDLAAAQRDHFADIVGIGEFL